VHSNKLFIIGNGFDIHHGIPSKYSDFKSYLKGCNQQLHDNLVEYLPIDEFWWELESSFANLDVDLVIDEATEFLQSYSADNWSDSFHHDYQFELDRIVADLSKNLKSHFVEWISQLELPLSVNTPINPIKNEKSSIFLTFNYTRTLEELYEISDDIVLHIHGKSGQDDSEIILGHSWNPNEIPDLNNVSNPEDIDSRVMEGNELINIYFSQTYKPSQKVISEHRSFFSTLKKIETIYVIGHSISEVDYLYFEEVVKYVSADTKWIVTYYGEDELQRHISTIQSLGITHVKFSKATEL